MSFQVTLMSTKSQFWRSASNIPRTTALHGCRSDFWKHGGYHTRNHDSNVNFASDLMGWTAVAFQVKRYQSEDFTWLAIVKSINRLSGQSHLSIHCCYLQDFQLWCLRHIGTWISSLCLALFFFVRSVLVCHRNYMLHPWRGTYHDYQHLLCTRHRIAFLLFSCILVLA